MKTFMPKKGEMDRRWYLVDAADQPLGRLAVSVANLLRGKHLPTFTPHVDTGAFVVVINAAKVKLTGNKEQQKVYRHYTGYAGGLKETPAERMRAKHPEYMIEHAVQGMLPKNRLSRQLAKKLKVYPGAEHPHEAQQPEVITVAS